MDAVILKDLINQMLDVQSSLIKPDDYVLTREEEIQAVNHVINQKKSYMVWKMNELSFSENQILQKISEVDWQKEVDVPEILKRANSSKAQNLWHLENRQKELADQMKAAEDLKNKWTAEYFYQFIREQSELEYGRKFVLNSSNKKYVAAICYFLSRDKRFESDLGFSLNKGLWVRGISGIGKTYIPKCASKNEINPILILSMLEITDEIKENGEFNFTLGDNKIIYFDDVGAEQAKVKHFGTTVSYFESFIQQTYLKKKTFNDLMVSTNNSFSEIEEKYGFRVRSRAKDMFNIIDLEGVDLRG